MANSSDNIYIKTDQEIKIMAEGGRVLSGILNRLITEVKPGIKTKELDNFAEDLILKSGSKCNFKGYEGFPACLCASVNDELVHCVPSNRTLKEGDLLTLDLGILWKGFHIDMAKTVPVGKISPDSEKIIAVTKEALKRGIEESKIGKTFGDIGNVIQSYVEEQGFNVVRELSGHGIGRELHEEPKVLNYGKKGEGVKIREGMVFCIEPMVTAGHWKLRRKGEFCFATRDGSLSCHFEAMVAITKEGPIILTSI